MPNFAVVVPHKKTMVQQAQASIVREADFLIG